MGTPNLSKKNDCRHLPVCCGCQMTPTGLVIPEGLTFEQWDQVGNGLQLVTDCLSFCIGDWLNYGERAYGEAYSQAEAMTGLSYQTLANAKWVAGSVEVSRRRESLPFSYHADVAALPPRQQEQLLRAAEPDEAGGPPKISRSELRRKVAELREDEGKPFDQLREERIIQQWLENRREAWPAKRRGQFVHAVEVALERLTS